MATTKIRGSTQILDGTITLAKLVSGYQIPTANLSDGASFLKRDGSIAFSADVPAGGFKLTGLGDATNAQDAVNLRTAQTLINGVAIKLARAVFVSNVALTGVQNPTGLTGVAGDVVLLTGQSTPSQNGLWQMNSGAWTRAASWPAASTQKATLVLIQEGTTYGDTKFICVTDGNIIVDTTATSWSQDSSGATYSNGNGLSLTGNVFAVKVGNGIGFDGSQNLVAVLDGTSLSSSVSGIKIANATAGYILQAGASGAVAAVAVTGDVTISSTGVTTVSVNTTTGFVKYANSVFNETPTGTINGSNVTFTLAATPIAASVRVYLNGQRMRSGAGNDYTFTGTTITMLFAPETGDVMLVDYLK